MASLDGLGRRTDGTDVHFLAGLSGVSYSLQEHFRRRRRYSANGVVSGTADDGAKNIEHFLGDSRELVGQRRLE